jgi:hypothetical protein
VNSLIIPLELNKFKELKQCVEEVNPMFISVNKSEERLTRKEEQKYLLNSEPTLIAWKKKGRFLTTSFPGREESIS